MGGDNTRFTFDRTKRYSSVRMQQGRVQLDADWNEQLDIQSHVERTTTGDTVGLCGAPMHDAGFGLKCKNSDIVAAGCQSGELVITKGRYYVDGILCENDNDMDLSKQDDLWPDALMVKLPGGTEKKLAEVTDGTYLAYLDVWERDITAIEDVNIREKALGGPDTATRTKTVRQVKLLKIDINKYPDQWCETLSNNLDWQGILQGSTGKLRAQTTGAAAGNGPCIISPDAGYRRLENQLYRVEVHKGGSRANATFKWSRDNGSVATVIEKIIGNKVTVLNTGKDAQSFASGQWVEILDDAKELKGEPGELVQIESVDIAARQITMKSQPATVVDVTLHAKLRRWDFSGDENDVRNGIQMKADQSLEGGITVQFSNAGTYSSGDYWLIPARTAIGDYKGEIEWSPNDFQLPHGIKRHYCPLALLTRAGGNWTLKSDCRKLFPPMTEMANLFYVSGDGQEAMPGQTLPKPFQVGVANGPLPVVRAKIKFQRTLGTGVLKPGVSAVDASGVDYITVLTDSKGIAECFLQLDTTNQTQQVEATLLIDGTTLYHPIRFNANLSKADYEAYTPQPCSVLPGNPKIPTTQEFLKKAFAGWPPLDAANNTTVKEILDTLLCRLDAGKIPYDPTVKKVRWEDIKETTLGEPPVPNNVQAALDVLVENLESSDITFRPKNCGDAENPTVRSLLGIQANTDIKLSDLLDRVLCELNAADLPIKKPGNLCKELNYDKVKTVQDALAVLCQMAMQQQPKVSTGLVVFKDVKPGDILSSQLLSHKLDGKYVAIMLGFEKDYPKERSVIMGDFFISQYKHSMFAYYNINDPTHFYVVFKDGRPLNTKLPKEEYRIRWWAIPAGVVTDEVVIKRPAVLIPDKEIALGILSMQPGMTLQELSSVFNVEQNVLEAHLGKFQQEGLLKQTDGRYFLK